MKDFRGFSLSLWDVARSGINSFGFYCRSQLNWDGPALDWHSEEKRHSTLELLHTIPTELWPRRTPLRILDAGCHDFSRAESLHEFFREQKPALTGIDADPYFVGGRAKRRAQALPNTSYLRANLFHWAPEESFDLVTAFFPFVSPHPALAWGLPHSWGDPHLWIRALERCLAPEGAVFTSHQGDWEEREFAEAIQNSSLQTIFRCELPGRATESHHPIRIGLHIRRPT